ncbi:Chaperone protein HtpG [Streptomyces glaucescens]
MDSQTSQSSQASSPPHTFQVDLRGLVDLLSHHLYSSPKVYLRELLQNAVDAITARRAEQPGAPARVRLYAEGGTLRVEDSGVGLTESDVHSLLATIGRSSKRADGLQEARADFLGQFGIGLLACFVVAERIRVVSRSARTPDARPVEWTASDDGSYTVRTLSDDARPEPGTTVHLVARAGAGEWLSRERVLALARDFGALLPYDVRVGEEAVTDLPAPWDRPYPSPAARRVALARHCHEQFGFTPLDSIGLDVPLARGRPGRRVLLRPRAARGARLLAAAAGAAGPAGRGARPPSAWLAAGAVHGEHGPRVRRARGVLRADGQRGACASGRKAYFTDSGQPRSGMEFLSVVALLMDRLTGLGLGEQAVAGPASGSGRHANSGCTRARRRWHWRRGSTSATARRTSVTASGPVWISRRWWTGCGWACATRARHTRRTLQRLRLRGSHHPRSCPA